MITKTERERITSYREQVMRSRKLKLKNLSRFKQEGRRYVSLACLRIYRAKANG